MTPLWTLKLLAVFALLFDPMEDSQSQPNEEKMEEAKYQDVQWQNLVNVTTEFQVTSQELNDYAIKVLSELHRNSPTKRPLREEILALRKKNLPNNIIQVKVAPPIEYDILREIEIQHDAVNITCVQEPFNAEGPNKWQPNFADTSLGCGWQGTLGGQEELLFEQSAELQQLHVRLQEMKCKDVLKTRTGSFGPGDGNSKAILIQGLSKDCFIDVSKEFYSIDGRKTSVYGDWFEGGPSVPEPLLTYEQMKEEKVITLFSPPRTFNVFCMTAPNCALLAKRTITKKNIADLFQTAFTSYCLIKSTSQEKQTVLGGYWGAGIFLNHPRIVAIVQMMAAQMIGVDFEFHDFPARFYPGQFEASKKFFDQQISPNIAKGCKVGSMIDKLYHHAVSSKWTYSKANPVPNAT